MNHKRRVAMLPIALIFAALAVFASTSPAFAEDQPPQPETTPTEVVSVSPEEEVAPDVVEEIPVEVTTEELSLSTDPGEEAASTAEEPIELALSRGDPWFKVGTTTYSFKFPGTCGSTPNCTESTTPIQAAVDYLRVHSLTPSDGIIHVESGIYTDDVVVYGDTYPILSNLRGFVAPVVNYLPSATINGGGFYIRSCKLGFTISGFSINSPANADGIVLNSCAGTVKLEDLQVTNINGTAIYVGTNGAITVNRVKSESNAGSGASLNGNTQSITVANSSFDHNSSTYVHLAGLMISSEGPISLNGVSASRNHGNPGGLEISSTSGAITIKNSFFNNNSAGPGFHYYGENSKLSLTDVYAISNLTGLDLSSSADILLSGVHANSNTSFAATLDTCSVAGGVCTEIGTGKVTIINSSFDNNGPTVAGLEITTRGAIILTNVSASGNNLNAANTAKGAIIRTDYSPLVSPVTIASSQFNQNDAGGVEIHTKGTITLNKVKANGNPLGSGALLDNAIVGTPAVNILGTSYGDNEFSQNGSTGLQVNTKGAVSFSYTTFENNGSDGLNLDQASGSPLPIKISYGKWDHNDGSGITVNSTGGITLSNLSISTSGEWGVHLITTHAAANVTLNNIYISNSGLSVGSAGLWINTLGTVTLTTVNVNHSSEDGGHIYNDTASPPKNVIITNGNFNNNDGDGLDISTNGAITLKNVNAYWNSGYGARLDNDSGIAGVTITNNPLPSNISQLQSPVSDVDPILKRDFSKNGSTGLWINSFGAISVTNVIVGKNGGPGVIAINTNTTLAGHKPMSFKNMRIFENAGTGITTNTEGALTLTDVFSWGHSLVNGSYGANLYNDTGSFGTPVTIKNNWYNSYYGFDNNRETGLWIHSSGTVTLDGAWASGCIDAGCLGIGISTVNYPVTVKNAMTMNNNGTGIDISTDRAITLIGGGAYSNKSIGAYLQNTGTLSQPVIITSYTADGNTSFGLQVISNGNITLTNTHSYNNGALGAHLNNDTCPNCFVKLLSSAGGWNEFNGNTSTGLEIVTHGPVTINNTHADNNSSGFDMDTEASSVTITNGSASGNDFMGMEILVTGPVTLSRVTATNNGNGGIFLDNHIDTTGLKTVTVTKCVANGNGNFGIDIETYGAININNIEASGNGYIGAYLNNDYATAKGISVLSTLGKNTFNGNTSSGLEFYSQGNVLLSGITADGNLGSWGVAGENNGTGTVTLSNIVTRFNQGQGIGVFANNAVTITNAISLSNSTAFVGAGIIVSNTALNSFIKIMNSVVSQNGYYGIRVDLNTGSTLTLTGTYYYGNNFNGGGYPNLLIE